MFTDFQWGSNWTDTIRPGTCFVWIVMSRRYNIDEKHKRFSSMKPYVCKFVAC